MERMLRSMAIAARAEASGTSVASASAWIASSHRPSQASSGTRAERNFASQPWWPTLRARANPRSVSEDEAREILGAAW